MARRRKKSKKARRFFVFGVTSIIFIGAMTFTIGRYWVDIISKYQEKKSLEKELIALKETEEELKVDANKLQDPNYIARYAREKYYYSKDGEFIIKMPEE